MSELEMARMHTRGHGTKDPMVVFDALRLVADVCALPYKQSLAQIHKIHAHALPRSK